MTDSPCVGICILEDGFCIGCGRTEEEIYQAGADAVRDELRPALTPIPTPAPR